MKGFNLYGIYYTTVSSGLSAKLVALSTEYSYAKSSKLMTHELSRKTPQQLDTILDETGKLL